MQQVAPNANGTPVAVEARANTCRVEGRCSVSEHAIPADQSEAADDQRAPVYSARAVCFSDAIASAESLASLRLRPRAHDAPARALDIANYQSKCAPRCVKWITHPARDENSVLMTVVRQRECMLGPSARRLLWQFVVL